MMIQNNRFLPPSPLPHSLLPRGRRQGRYVPFSANHTNGTTYDFLGQLIAAGYSNTGLTDESYSYDSNGNRITANGSNYTTGSNNELTSDGSWTYTYDDEGNRVSKTNSTHRELYEWDYRNRLTKVTQQEYNSSTEEWQDVQIVEYTYDYNNIWIRKLLDTNGDGTPDSKSIFIPENYQTTVQIDDGIVTHHYLWTPNQQDKLLADTTSTDVLWSLTDHLGTIRDILAATSTHLIYDAFGNLTSGTNPILFGYTGKPFDADTALQNNINRWYDATVGRWLSTDPIEFSAGDSNLYRYIKNRCILECDYLGLLGLWDWIKDSATFVDQRAGQVAVFLVTLDWIDADTASFSEFVCDTSCGLVQGGANTVNGVQDGAVGLANLGIIGARYMGADWEYFQSPDWSRNLIVSEPGIPGTWSDAHGWGKFIGGESLTFLLTQGLSGIRWGEKGRTLIHYTTTDGAMGIRQSQKIMGKGGIFAVDSSIQNPPFFLWKLRNTPEIKIPIEGVIASKFQPVPVVGLISFMAKTKNSYVIYANSIDLANGCIKNFDGWVPIIQINGPIFFDATAGQLLWTTPQVLQGTLFPSETGMDMYKK